MGYGLPAAVAAALLYPERPAVNITGDGDFLMGVTALWTAVHYRIALLIVVANNRTFYNDEVHQELRGERSGARYAVGTRVRVQVSRVDLDSRRIDFRLVRDGEGRKLSKSSAATGLRELRAQGATPADIRRRIGLP